MNYFAIDAQYVCDDLISNPKVKVINLDHSNYNIASDTLNSHRFRSTCDT